TEVVNFLRREVRRRACSERPRVIGLPLGQLPDSRIGRGFTALTRQLGDLTVERGHDLARGERFCLRAARGCYVRDALDETVDDAPLGDWLRPGVGQLFDGLLEQERRKYHAASTVMTQPFGLPIERPCVRFHAREIGGRIRGRGDAVMA